jgi:ketosteroid isomerase-like protein
MSRETTEILRRWIAAWNQRDADLWLSFFAPDAEWLPAGPAAVERAVYRGHDDMAGFFADAWKTWDVFQLVESEVRGLGTAALWLGRVKMRGSASQIELDNAFAVYCLFAGDKIIRGRTFHSWEEALKAVGLEE